MNKFLATLLIYCLTITSVVAGLPPTAIKGSGDASYSTFFKLDTGDLPITMSGVNAKIGPMMPKNYITATDGSKIGAWATYADAAGTSPVDGTGGSPSSTFAVSTNSDLRGTTNFLWTHSAANRQGEGFSYNFTIDPADTGKVLRIDFDYMVASGTYADDDMQFWVYDVTNAALIQPAPFKLKNTTIKDHFAMEFQTTTSTSYRLIGHVATATATAYTLRFTSWSVGAGAKVYSVADTSYSAAVSSADAVSNENKDWINGNCTNATTGAGTCTFTTGIFTNSPNCVCTDNESTTSGASRVCQITAVSSTAVTYYTYANGAAQDNAIQISCQKSSTDYTNATAGRVSSSEADTRVVAATYYVSTGVSTTVDTPVNYDTKLIDTHAAVTTGVGTWKFTTPVPGTYRVHGVSKNSGSSNLKLWKNGSAIQYLSLHSTTQSIPFTYLIQLVAGDYIDARYDGTVTPGSATGVLAQSTINIEKVQGPSQIQASETVSFSANTSTTAATTSAPFVYTVKDHDTHNAYSTSTGKFTAPMSGKYQFESCILTAANASPVLYKNTTAFAQGSFTNSGNTVGCVSFSTSLLTGDTVEVRPNTNATASGASYQNIFSGFRVGL